MRSSLCAKGESCHGPQADVTRTVCDGVRTQALGALTFADDLGARRRDRDGLQDEQVLDALRWAIMLEAEADASSRPRALTLAALRSGAVIGERYDRSSWPPEATPTLRCLPRCSRAKPAYAVDRLAGAAAPGDTDSAARPDRRARATRAIRRPCSDAGVVGVEGRASEPLAPSGVALPPLEHVEVDVRH